MRSLGLSALATLTALAAGAAAAQGRGSAAPDTARATFTVGTATAKRGETAYGTLVVPPNGDAGTSIDVAVVHGAKPGRIVAFIAGSHGTEYASVVALSRLIAKIDATRLNGTVIVAPLLNVASWEQMTVHVNPVDKKGMNASYPGNPGGTQSERALDLVARQIVEPADVVVDLHGGDLDEDLRPYSYWIRTGDAAQDSASRALVMAFGLDHVILRDVDTKNAASTRSLSGYALARGKTTFVAEAGRSGLVLTPDVDALVNGSLNVLGALKLIDRSVKPLSSPTFITAGSRVAAEKGGMFFPSVARDTRVAKDQVLGYTTDYVGRKTGDIKSPVTGLVTFIRGVPSLWPGATIVNVAEILTSVPPYKKP
ncbi:MAG TPA: succinylglutamate desuccinylase/aspartoacylase family protein [Gemmatimonadaceae bacterium]|nr:succinylglutamate desuccinylase/aspartoacylase family protein [Gemmatimonadaceae bacterium]